MSKAKNEHTHASAMPEREVIALPAGTLAGFVCAVVAVVLIAFASQRANDSRTDEAERVVHTLHVIQQLALVASLVSDAETGQRGYLLTGDEQYLEPYNRAEHQLAVEMDRLRAETSDNNNQQQRLDGLQVALTGRLAVIAETVRFKQAGNSDAALAIVRSGRGKALMDVMRQLIAEMNAEEQSLLQTRQQGVQQATMVANAVTWGGSGLLLLLIVASAFLMSRDHRARGVEIWLKDRQTRLLTQMQGELVLDDLGEKLLASLAEYLGAAVGALYVSDDKGQYRRIAGFALPSSHHGESAVVRDGAGIIGQAIKQGRSIHVSDVPDGYLPISSGVGKATARHLLVTPLESDGIAIGAVELGFFRPVRSTDTELLDRVSEAIVFAIASSKYKARLRDLLDESQRQAEELQSQQSALETQQAELEATNEEMNQANALMEVQTEELERQRDYLARATADAERASRYKSEFLANMSHELRTPLNSSLILARLLGDNKEGNLTADQVKSAETIYTAGNDLLVLINDILDLAKIESGHADVAAQPIVLTTLVENLERSFRPVAADRRVALRITSAADNPRQITTDGRRLEQILRNLLSNAFKFTEKGEVELSITPSGAEHIALSVRDTGIGIEEHQQDVIFEAFRQADGTTSRKYGGTGLGLSISRELAHLLGGELSVSSVPGQGSTFTLLLPLNAAPAQPRTEAERDQNGSRAEVARAMTPTPANTRALSLRMQSAIPDDRTALTRRGRLILAVEDDVPFAQILFDLAHELNFDCVIAATADEGLALARELQPSGILLDIGLPDASGLSVLEQLKRDPATRHLPIHIVSSADTEQTALELGAIGYTFKPVARDQLVAAFKKLEEQHTRGVRRVLVVEDDPRQRESVQRLLAGEGVELIAAGSIKDALLHLEEHSVDCMVLDLTLPDGSGYELLEKMAEGTRYSFPPVIVYTGRQLERADEEKLRRYSRSIIVKGARSPERLLDEVTLFLHQVESTLPAEQRRLLADARQREAAFEGRRILVVEDDVRNVFALTKVLEPRGAKIEIARNGREALEILQRVNNVDLVLMDLMMPEMDGLTAIREIRKNDAWRRLPIIALTAKAMSDDREQAMKAGANDYMAKPFEVDKLVSLCRVWLPR